MLHELSDLFESLTIKPAYDYVHVLLALYIFGENDNGIGRYRLTKDLLVGSGTARSLITKLNEKLNFITVLSSNNKTKGHILTEKGIKFLKKIKAKIPLIKEGEVSIFKEIIIKAEDVNPYFCLVKNAATKISNGIDQRDAAIKIGGTGATCLTYNGQDLIFPSMSSPASDKVKENVLSYFKTQLVSNNVELEKNDVIIIGLGDNLQKSRLAALNAALTLIEN
jgi:hypothetical protein